MTYKMIVLDLDDTLLRDDHSISEVTKQALMDAQNLGVKVVLASGRPTFGMKQIAEELKLAEFGSYLISFNGGKIYNCRNYEELFSSTISPESVRSLYEISRRENVYIHTYIGDAIITDTENEYTTIESEITGLPIKRVNNFPDVINEPVVKVLMCDEPERLKGIELKLQEELKEEFSVMRSKPFFLEFTERDVTKGTSLQYLIQTWGIKREEVIAIGDSYNDVEMIKFAGLGVAMGNAPDDIKDLADYVTDTNMNDGVAKVVEKFIINEPVPV